MYQEKYVALEDQYNETRSALTKTQLEKEEIEAKYAQIEERVANYNAKIKSLSEANTDLENNSLRNYGNVVLSKGQRTNEGSLGQGRSQRWRKPVPWRIH